MGHCKHQWTEATRTLQAVFHDSERRTHAFYVCVRCLKIDEVLSAPMPMPHATDASSPSWSDDERDAA